MHAVVWRDGHMTDIGTLGGPTSMATGISNTFAVVGTASIAGGGPLHGFLWRANQGAMHNLGIPLPVRIGDTGAIVGNAMTAAGESVAAYRSQHGWVQLPLPGFDGSHGEDVNDAGTAVGTLFTEPHGSAPFVYANGVLTDPAVRADRGRDVGRRDQQRRPDRRSDVRSSRDRAVGRDELAAGRDTGARSSPRSTT